MAGENVYPAARALMALKYGGNVSLDSISMDEEVGFLLVATAIRALVRKV